MTCYMCGKKCDKCDWKTITVGKIEIQAAICKSCDGSLTEKE